MSILIPSNLELFDVEYEMAAAGADGGSILATRFRKLKAGLTDLARSYDVVLLDPPPALGTISLAVMQAANALIVPLAATTPDFCSTVQFLSMMEQVIDQLGQAGIDVDYAFVRLNLLENSTGMTPRMPWSSRSWNRLSGQPSCRCRFWSQRK